MNEDLCEKIGRTPEEVTIGILNHWLYVKGILVAHGEDEDVIRKIGHHYMTAFEHGLKHGIEEATK